MSEAIAISAARLVGIPDEALTPRHGWANEAWLGPGHVVRVSSGRLRSSLAHEAAVVREVGDLGVIPVATVVGHGRVTDLDAEPTPDTSSDAEWLVSLRLAGDTLAERWAGLAAQDRRSVGAQLGGMLRHLHTTMSARLAPAWWSDAHHDTHLVHNAYRPRVELGPALVEAARDVARLPSDTVTLDETEALLQERMPLFCDDDLVFIHGDIHAHNLLVDGRGLTGVLDWEGAHHAPRDQELDMFLRYVSAAHAFPERPGLGCAVAENDMLELVDHVGTSYPELFDGPRLRERLEVYDAHWHLISILVTDRLRAPGDPATRDPAWARLRELLDGQSHVRRFAA